MHCAFPLVLKTTSNEDDIFFEFLSDVKRDRHAPHVKAEAEEISLVTSWFKYEALAKNWGPRNKINDFFN